MKLKNELKSVIFSLIAFALPVHATTNTLSLVDEYRTSDGKMCIYSDGDRTETYEKDGAGSCPSKKTFH